MTTDSITGKDAERNPGLNRRELFLSGIAALFASSLPALGAAAPGAQVVFQHDLPDLTLKDWSVTAVEVSYAPGESSPAHRHPGITVAYVLEGEIRSRVGDAPEQTYRAGQMFFENPGELHAVSRNASTTQPAKLLALLFAEKGARLTSPA
jgi:quercetin dioxygenase-like cupin family protein